MIIALTFTIIGGETHNSCSEWVQVMMTKVCTGKGKLIIWTNSMAQIQLMTLVQKMGVDGFAYFNHFEAMKWHTINRSWQLSFVMYIHNNFKIYDEE